MALNTGNPCPKCGTKTLESDPEGDIHCWTCGMTVVKVPQEKRPQATEYPKRQRAATLSRKEAQTVIENLKTQGQDTSELEEAVNQTFPLKATRRRTKDRRKTMRQDVYERSRYYQENKDAILADLQKDGRQATRRRWQIPASTLTRLESKWLTDEQRATIPFSAPSILRQDIPGTLPTMPSFTDCRTPEVQREWLRVYERVIIYYERYNKLVSLESVLERIEGISETIDEEEGGIFREIRETDWQSIKRLVSGNGIGALGTNGR